MQIDIWDLHVRDTIHACWYRLPRDVQRALDHVTFTHHATSSGGRPYKAYASAGRADIDIYDLPITTDASIGVIAHELGHIAGDHFRRLHSGEITEQEAEREADAYVRHWGFGRELDARRLWIGR